MKSEVRDHGNVRLIALTGKITIGAGDVKLRELVNTSLEDGKANIVLDLGGVSAIDSSGISWWPSSPSRGSQKAWKKA